MKRTLPILCAVLCAFAFAACSGGDDGGASDAVAIFFAPANADALAHAALPAVADLPGSGWEITAQDDFGEDDDDDLDFETFAATEPACAQLSGLANLGGIFGGGEDDEPAGRAQIEFENAMTESLLPSSIEVEVEIEETVAEVEGAWTLVKDLMESDETEACMLAVFDTMFGELAEQDIEVEVMAAEASSDAPNNGATMAFDIHMDISGIELDMAMEIYFWPYGNAALTVSFLGTPDTLDADTTGPTLDAVAEKLKAASEG